MGRFLPEIPHEELQSRRKKCQQRMEDGSLLLLFTGPRQILSNDVHHRFRQDSDFYYLTGLPVEEGILALSPESATVYIKPGSPEKETWEGPQPDIIETTEISGIEDVRPWEKFDEDLESLLKNRSALYYPYSFHPEWDQKLLSLASRLHLRGRGGDAGPGSILHSAELVHELRMFKSDWEIARMQETAAITTEAHMRVIEATRPGVFESELEGVLFSVFRKHGANEAYPSIVAGGPRACILHYIKNDTELKEGQSVLMDAAAARNYIHSDVTRCFPVGKRFTQEQRTIYEIVLKSQKEAVAATVVGATMDLVHEKAVSVLVEGLRSIGLLKGTTEQILEEKSYRRFYMHRTGHWIGHDVHDVGRYYIEGKPRHYEPGMVTTVEPGLYIPQDDDIPAGFRGIGIRIEDDVVVTKEGPLNLTQSMPVEIEQIEGLK